MSGAFDDNPDREGVSAMSVYVEERLAELGIPVSEVLSGYPGYGLVAITVEAVRDQGFGVVWAPDPSQGGIGEAHADVHGAKSRKKQRRLRDACEKVIWPP